MFREMAKKEKILQSVPLVAIDLGSHNVRAMAAEMTNSGLLRVLGVESSSKFECVEKGIVTHTANAGFILLLFQAALTVHPSGRGVCKV